MHKHAIDQITSCGFDVYMHDPKDSYLFFTDGTAIGYLQYDNLSGYTITTVHKPCSSNGAGFQVERHYSGPLSQEVLERAFITTAPRWARSDKPVVKYKDMQAYLEADSWNAQLHLVAPGLPIAKALATPHDTQTIDAGTQ